MTESADDKAVGENVNGMRSPFRLSILITSLLISGSGSEKTLLAEEVSVERINKLLDKLCLEMLVLMERQIEQKRKIEMSMTEGESHLVKSRFIMGHRNVSALQLPTENSPDITAGVTVRQSDKETYLDQPLLELNVEPLTKPKPNALTETGLDEKEIEKTNSNVQDPIHWFGLLVPKNLHLAQASFSSAVSWVVDCANTQIKLHQVCVKIRQLRDLRKNCL